MSGDMMNIEWKMTQRERIETAEQLAYLEQAGCDKIQGYYISHPIPFSELIDGYDSILSKVYTLMLFLDKVFEYDRCHIKVMMFASIDHTTFFLY